MARSHLLPALVALVGTLEMVAGRHGPVVIAAYWAAAAALAAAPVAPLAVPPAVAAAWAVALALDGDASDPASWVLVLAAACLACGLYAAQAAGLVSVLLALAGVVAALALASDLDPGLPFGLVVTVGPWAMGAALRTSLERNRRLAAEAEHARIERGLARERAAEAERDRIAGELYDVLAHALGAMVVQASVAADLLRRDVGAAGGALRDVAQAGREALAETGRLLRLIRDERGELALRPPAEAAIAAAPAPPDTGASATAMAGAGAARDVALPALLGLVGTVEIVVAGGGPRWGGRCANWNCGPVGVARRAAPRPQAVAIAAVLVAADLLGVAADDPTAWLLVSALACMAPGLHSRARALGLASVLAAAGLLITTISEPADIVLVFALAVGAWAVGAGLAATLDRTRELSAATERARMEQELEAERGATAERKLVARELHDLLARSLSVMIVQASGGADLATADPARAADAVAEGERAGRAALGEIGRLLRLIGNDTTEPQRGVADLPALADEYARAGLGVELELAEIDVPIGVGLSTYRIVQEALTNALKHAPGSAVHVTLARDGAAVAVEVRNGRAAAPALAVSGGHGLVGLRERVALFGGRIDARATDDGGFVLAATLPVNEP